MANPKMGENTGSNCKRLPCSVLLFFLVLFAGACPAFGGSSPKETRPAPERVTLQLRWLHQFQFAGYYAAKEKGFYREAGMDVVIKEGGLGRLTVEEVLDGRAHFGVTNSEILLHRLRGKPLVMLASVFQHSPLVIVSRNTERIRHPQDLPGKRLKITRGSRDVELHAMLMNEGVPLDRVEILDGDVAYEDYFDPDVDALSAYLTNEPFYYEENSVPYTVMYPATYGIDFYGDCLFTSQKQIDKRPEQVRAFLEASLRGWNYAMKHPEEIIELIIAKYGSEKKREHLRYEAAESRKLIIPDLGEIGRTNPDRWRHIADTFARFDLVGPDRDLSGFIYTPEKEADSRRFRYFAGLALAISLVLGSIASVLFFFNKKLQKEVDERKEVEKALLKSERQKQAILDGITSNLAYVNRDMEIMWVNKSSVDSVDQVPEKMIGRKCHEIWAGSESPCENCPTVKAFRTGVSQKAVVRTPDGRIWDERGEPVFDDDGNLIGVIEIAHDITDRQKAEKEQKELREKLARSKKMEAIGLLAGGVAHDLNNILTGIVGYPELLLLDPGLNKEQKAAIKIIHEAGLRASAVVSDLLAIGRSRFNSKHPENLNALISDCLESPEFLKIRHKFPKVEIQTDLADSLPPIPASRIHVVKMLMNLVLNAAEAIVENGLVKISTRGRMVDSRKKSYENIPKGEYVVLSVSDDGPGIPGEDLDRIFEPFFSSKASGTSGTGLGLSVVWNTVKDHGGYIDVISADSGAAFEIYLPAACDPAGQKTESTALKDLAGNGQRVLVIDDDDTQRLMAEKMLSLTGYRVTTAADGNQALRIIEKNPVDLVVLDMVMGNGMDGKQIHDKIRRLYPRQKVVVVSGCAQNDEVKDILEHGGGRFVQKPFTMETICAAVKATLAETSRPDFSAR